MKFKFFFILLLGLLSNNCYASNIYASKEVQQQRGVQYYLTQECFACYTKEDLKYLTKLAVRNDKKEIDRMWYAGKIVIIGPGPCKVLDRGILVSLVEFRGKRVYIENDFITTDRRKVKYKK